jgi:hypothetical protein
LTHCSLCDARREEERARSGGAEALHEAPSGDSRPVAFFLSDGIVASADLEFLVHFQTSGFVALLFFDDHLLQIFRYVFDTNHLLRFQGRPGEKSVRVARGLLAKSAQAFPALGSGTKDRAFVLAHIPRELKVLLLHNNAGEAFL